MWDTKILCERLTFLVTDLFSTETFLESGRMMTAREMGFIQCIYLQDKEAHQMQDQVLRVYRQLFPHI